MNELTASGNSGYKIELLCNQSDIEAISNALDDCATAIAAFETVPNGQWRIEVYCTDAPDLDEVAKLLAGRDYEIQPLPRVDWLAENRRNFPPQSLGRFYIYGSHIEKPVPVGRIGLLVEAATAFGSGEHPTTRLCLERLAELTKRRRSLGRVVDIGTGSGILSLAAARLGAGVRRATLAGARLGQRIIAADLDAHSVVVARANGVINRVDSRILWLVARGYDHRLIRRHAPYDVILCNILAGPLQQLAPDLRRNLAKGGTAILSGLLVAQERQVVAAHRAQGLTLVSRHRLDGWSALVFTLRQ